MTKILNVFNKISTFRERYYKAFLGKDSLIRIIAETEVAEQVYNSNAIENSTLTLEETEKILLQIELDRYISERELFEARNLGRVVSYIDKRAKRPYYIWRLASIEIYKRWKEMERDSRKVQK